ncbi:hypothetical protein CDAR_57491 [Caerostris darwini]|uniref:Uncharacterized protein n=1 Tax=Caerostris darwini TaxID=1538125 RepID=A0AAV4SXY1_9ARAC|nr:hypothetical protein CDAR_57491 [Caerostris darwini]
MGGYSFPDPLRHHYGALNKVGFGVPFNHFNYHFVPPIMNSRKHYADLLDYILCSLPKHQASNLHSLEKLPQLRKNTSNCPNPLIESERGPGKPYNTHLTKFARVNSPSPGMTPPGEVVTALLIFPISPPFSQIATETFLLLLREFVTGCNCLPPVWLPLFLFPVTVTGWTAKCECNFLLRR